MADASHNPSISLRFSYLAPLKKKKKKKRQDLWALQAFMNRSAFLLNKRIETTKQKSHPFLLFSLAEAMAALWILM